MPNYTLSSYYFVTFPSRNIHRNLVELYDAAIPKIYVIRFVKLAHETRIFIKFMRRLIVHSWTTVCPLIFLFILQRLLYTNKNIKKKSVIKFYLIFLCELFFCTVDKKLCMTNIYDQIMFFPLQFLRLNIYTHLLILRCIT